MNIQMESRDQALSREVRECSAALVRKRVALSRLEQQSTVTFSAAELEAHSLKVTELLSRGRHLDRQLNDLQREQRLRARSRGIALATCRVEWP
jgi:hypothetical protein